MPSPRKKNKTQPGFPVKHLRLLLILIPVVIPLQVISGEQQIDPRKRDSLARTISDSARSLRNWQDSFRQAQDSIYLAAQHRALQKQVPDLINPESKRKNEQKRRRMVYLGIGMGVLIFIGLVVAMARSKPGTDRT